MRKKMKQTNHDEINDRLKLINQALGTTLRTMKSTLLLVDEIIAQVQHIKKTFSTEKDVLKFIDDMDRCGINMTKELLSARLQHIQNIEQLYISLLKSGLIFEIEGIVYPTTTKNDVKNEEKK